MLALADFAGAWRVHRVIDGQPMAGHLVGLVEFWQAPAGLIYRETGTLTLAEGRAFEATRSYHWAQDGARIVVSFDDGRAFHDFIPSGEATGRHWCSPDVYEVTYDFTQWPTWTSLWAVSGPRKDYRMLTRYAPTTE